MNEYIICRELIQNCFSDLWTLYLTLIGILLSILTLLYSFIIGKKDELKLIAEQIKLDGATPLVNQRKNFAISYIRRLSGINQKCFLLLLISIIMDVLCWVGMRLSFIFDNTILLWLLVITIIFTILIGGYTVYLGYKLIKQYISDTKI
jgi:hypothetical protein